MTNAFAVVAHFDDAIIWCGGAIRKTCALGWNWTIVCTCAAERDRRQYFLESCAELGVRAVALEFADHSDGGPFSHNDRGAVIAAVAAAGDGAALDWAFTHDPGSEGEYGPHPNHTEAAEAAACLVGKGMVGLSHIAHFAYRRIYGSTGLSSVAAPGASYHIQLDYDELVWKAQWCARARDIELGDPDLGGVTWLERLGWPCPNPEAFSGEGLLLPVPFTRR